MISERLIISPGLSELFLHFGGILLNKLEIRWENCAQLLVCHLLSPKNCMLASNEDFKVALV